MKNTLIRFAFLAVALLAISVRAADIAGEDKIYSANADDTLASIGEANDVGFVALRAANPDVMPWAIDAGKEIILPGAVILPTDAPHTGIVINIGEMRLYDFIDPAKPKIYTIGIGREGLVTPLGDYHIGSKVKGPTWHPTPRMRAEDPTLPAAVPAGPDNPLGAYAMYLEGTQYRIHGTNKPWGVGRRASSGCIRMYAPEIDALFHHTSLQTTVHIISEPIKVAVKDGAVYLEAHPDEDMADAYENDYAMDFKMPTDTLKMILAKSGDLKDKLDWAKIRDVLLLRPGYPVKISS